MCSELVTVYSNIDLKTVKAYNDNATFLKLENSYI